jgi:FAD/FMN-containing dehydrogenase
MNEIASWGMFPPHSGYGIAQLNFSACARTASRVSWPKEGTLLPFGLGRSYGDVCLNTGHSVLPMRELRCLRSFDEATGVLRCEAGVSIGEILSVFVPRGWFVPVTPGTKFVTVGGAIANDVHGKNHHRSGTFGRWVRRLMLARSDGTETECSSESNPDLFGATIGGLGLTGVILWADIQLTRVAGPWMMMDSIPFGHYRDFFSLSRESEQRYDFVVAWVDCLARGGRLGRGVLYRGKHATEPGPVARRLAGEKIVVPFTAPPWLLSSWSMRAFNSVYGALKGWRIENQRVHYDPFFYPLDAVGRWNRLYGPRGFLQFQCVASQDAVGEILDALSRSGAGSFLAVLKEFGDMPSPGIMSFPQPGVTLALDLPITGEDVFRLVRRLEDIVVADRGRIYPAKDAVMQPRSFAAFFPRWREVERLRDPRISSSFWRRVTKGLSSTTG